MEVVLALGLSSLVMMALMVISTQMIRQHMHELGVGAATSNALLALGSLNNDVENATYIRVHATVDFPGNEFSGCSNWSAEYGGRMAPAALELGAITAFFYCYTDPAVGTPGEIFRYFDDNGPCPFSPPSTCGLSSGGITPTKVAGYVTKHGTYEIFSFSTSPTSGLAVHFTVGLSTAGGVKKDAGIVGTELRVDTFIRFNKSFNVHGE